MKMRSCCPNQKTPPMDALFFGLKTGVDSNLVPIDFVVKRG